MKSCAVIKAKISTNVIKTTVNPVQEKVAVLGVAGKQGPQGPQGETGEAGQAASIEVGRVATTTLEPGASATATVTNAGSSSDASFDFNFGIPGSEETESISNQTIYNIVN